MSDPLPSTDAPLSSLERLFPTRESLSSIGPLCADPRDSAAQLDSVMSEKTRDFAEFNGRATSILSATTESTANIDARLSRLRTQARETERVIEESCGTVRMYDTGRRNLIETIKVFKRL
jgi:Asp-tRNA(Asn)/Glu-tRNA(Gln) amidotransferase A subunit family amidase